MSVLHKAMKELLQAAYKPYTDFAYFIWHSLTELNIIILNFK
jgi:hypothetical protein